MPPRSVLTGRLRCLARLRARLEGLVRLAKSVAVVPVVVVIAIVVVLIVVALEAEALWYWRQEQRIQREQIAKWGRPIIVPEPPPEVPPRRARPRPSNPGDLEMVAQLRREGGL